MVFFGMVRSVEIDGASPVGTLATAELPGLSPVEHRAALPAAWEPLGTVKSEAEHGSRWRRGACVAFAHSRV